MKKRILLASAIGIAGGLGYWLTRSNSAKAKKGETLGGDAEAKPPSTEKQSGRGNGHFPDFETTTQASAPEHDGEALDDRGTDQTEASHILKDIRDEAFDGSDEKLALALGRPIEEIESWTSGDATIDGDVVMKARGLALQRGIDLGEAG